MLTAYLCPANIDVSVKHLRNFCINKQQRRSNVHKSFEVASPPDVGRITSRPTGITSDIVLDNAV